MDTEPFSNSTPPDPQSDPPAQEPQTTPTPTAAQPTPTRTAAGFTATPGAPGSTSTPDAPPTSPPDEALLQKEPPTVWPRAFGIAGIILGGMGIIGSLLAVVFLAFIMPAVAARAPAQGTHVAFPSTATAVVRLLLIPGSALSCLQVAAGVGLVRRRRWAVRVTWIWAIATIPIVCAGVVYNWITMEAQIADYSAAIGVRTGSPRVAESTTAMNLLLTLIWGIGVPTFMMFWLARPAVKRETAEWP